MADVLPQAAQIGQFTKARRTTRQHLLQRIVQIAIPKRLLNDNPRPHPALPLRLFPLRP